MRLAPTLIAFAAALAPCLPAAFAAGVDDQLVRVATDDIGKDPALKKAAIALGRDVYTAHCAACHGADLKGMAGKHLLISATRPHSMAATISTRSRNKFFPPISRRSSSTVSAPIIRRRGNFPSCRISPGWIRARRVGTRRSAAKGSGSGRIPHCSAGASERRGGRGPRQGAICEQLFRLPQEGHQRQSGYRRHGPHFEKISLRQ